MKKRILCAALALVMLLGSVPALAFSDIPDSAEKSAAEALASLGIVADVDRYNPNSNLTRAEFCKIATLALGFAEHNIYNSLTIFPDVKHTSWFASYVNASVRKFQIIRGYPSGRFEPNRDITYGEAVTILLRMLGYETADIGAMWPRDYVVKASVIGLTNGMKTLSAANAIPRGQAAILLRNLLLLPKKDGTPFLSVGFGNAVENAILLGTPENDTTLSANQLRFYIDDKATVVTGSGTVKVSSVGLRGLLVYSKQNAGRIAGFVPDAGAEYVTVKSVTSERLETSAGTLITIPREAQTAVSGTVATWPLSWYDVAPGSSVAIYRTDRGIISLVSVLSGSTAAYTSTMVYGIDPVIIASGARIIKDGASVSADALKNYDVVSYTASDNTYYVSSQRVTLLYESGGPTYSSPSQITAGGAKFTISPDAAKYFANLQLGTPITLLFDQTGKVAGAVSPSKASGTAIGVLKSTTDSEAVVRLLNGVELKGKPSLSSTVIVGGEEFPRIYLAVGQLVTVSQDNYGKLSCSAISYTSANAGEVNAAQQLVGTRKISPTARIFEQPAPGIPLREIALADLPAKVAASRVVHVALDMAGNVSLLVLGNVTGDGYTYGFATEQRREIMGSDLNGDTIVVGVRYVLTMRTPDGKQEYQGRFAASAALGTTPVPVGIATGSYDYLQSIPSFQLLRIGAVSRDAFNGTKSVKISGVFVPLAENCAVYVKKLDKYIPLAEARANFTSFSLYCDRDVASGGSVRIIVAE